MIAVALYGWKKFKPAGLFCQCLDLQGNVLLGQSELEMIKGEWSPAGEMRHTDKMYPMMGNHAMAPRGNV